MTDREAMQQALAALDRVMSHGSAVQEAKDILRERLEQPQRTHWEGCEQVHPECKKPEQEPVAWVDESAIRWLADRKGKVSAHCTTKLSAARSFEKPMPIYTTPPRREWVGLTDEEKAELDAEYGDDTLAHLDAIEAKLKEKNNG